MLFLQKHTYFVNYYAHPNTRRAGGLNPNGDMIPVMSIESSLLREIPNLVHGFGTRKDPVPSVFLSEWASKPRWKQVHGVACAEVTSVEQDCGEADALFSQIPQVLVGVQTADCVPILLASRRMPAVAAVHAGWRGTQAKILRALWKKLSELGHRPRDWVAAIGPSIGPCCYEVSEDLARSFEAEFGGGGRPNPVPKFRRLDLPSVNEGELRSLGLVEIEVLRACTFCSREYSAQEASDGSPRFESYRRDGSGGRQWSVIKVQTV